MSCFCGDNPNEACGYPPKTIRAIISVTACITSFLLFSFLVIFLAIKEQYTEAIGVVGIISTELGTIVGYYFGTRSKQELDMEDIERRQRDLLIAEGVIATGGYRSPRMREVV